MKREIAEAWVKDLRENSSLQGKGRLYLGGKFCCLGRLILLLGGEVNQDRLLLGYEHCECWLPDEAICKSGVKDQVFLAQMNDTGNSFDEIADYIEKNWKAL